MVVHTRSPVTNEANSRGGGWRSGRSELVVRRGWLFPGWGVGAEKEIAVDHGDREGGDRAGDEETDAKHGNAQAQDGQDNGVNDNGQQPLRLEGVEALDHRSRRRQSAVDDQWIGE